MDSKVHHDLRNLKEKHILEMIGYGKHVHYLILEYLNDRKNSVAV